MRQCILCEKEYRDERKEYYCEECEEKLKKIKTLKMLDKAEKKILKDIKTYRNAKKEEVLKHLKIVEKRIFDGIDKFSSVPEVIIAIQMQNNELEYESQKKIGTRKVDFYIPGIKIILEIDGEIYHSNENEMFFRDRQIMAQVGEEWEIIHIDPNKIPKYTWNLKDALPYVVSERNDNFRFRDSALDSDFLTDFYGMKQYLRRNKH